VPAHGWRLTRHVRGRQNHRYGHVRPEKNKLPANIYCNNAKAFVTRAQRQHVLKHIANTCTRTDQSEGRSWIYGGTTTTDDGNFTTELWYDKP
jgi:hypothetical protein